MRLSQDPSGRPLVLEWTPADRKRMWTHHLVWAGSAILLCIAFPVLHALFPGAVSLSVWWLIPYVAAALFAFVAVMEGFPTRVSVEDGRIEVDERKLLGRGHLSFEQEAGVRLKVEPPGALDPTDLRLSLFLLWEGDAGELLVGRSDCFSFCVDGVGTHEEATDVAFRIGRSLSLGRFTLREDTTKTLIIDLHSRQAEHSRRLPKLPAAVPNYVEGNRPGGHVSAALGEGRPPFNPGMHFGPYRVADYAMGEAIRIEQPWRKVHVFTAVLCLGLAAPSFAYGAWFVSRGEPILALWSLAFGLMWLVPGLRFGRRCLPFTLELRREAGSMHVRRGPFVRRIPLDRVREVVVNSIDQGGEGISQYVAVVWLIWEGGRALVAESDHGTEERAALDQVAPLARELANLLRVGCRYGGERLLG